MNDYERNSTKVNQLAHLLRLCPENYVIRTMGSDPTSLGAINLIVINHVEEAVTLYSYPVEDCRKMVQPIEIKRL